MEQRPAVVVEGLVKDFGGFRVLRGISFSVFEGEIFGLIGPNGAGKTTTLRILATIIKPTKGKIKIYNHDISDSSTVRKLIGYLPEDAGLYERLTGLENLKVFARLYSRNESELNDMVKYAIEIADLGDRIYDKVSEYSKGMKRRLLLARALMVKPKLAILDEPTSGLDVVHAFHVRRIIKEYVEKYGVTVILSSHNMLDVEYLCDRVAFIDKGRILDIGAPKELIEKYDASNLEEAFAKVTTI